MIISDRLPVRFANAPLEELRKLIDAINRSVVPQLFSAANRNPWFAKNTHATDFFVFYRINLFNLLAQNSNDNLCIFLYYMPEVPNVGLIFQNFFSMGFCHNHPEDCYICRQWELKQC